MIDDLADAIAVGGAALLRSAVEGAAAPSARGSLQLEAALDLGEGRWVCVVGDADGRRWTLPAVRDGSVVRRARAGDGVAEALVCRLAGPGLAAPFAATRFAAARPVVGERAMGVDQTNESVVVGDAAVVKWSLELPSRGALVADTASRRLAALADDGFDGMPALWGLASVDLGESAPIVIASVAEFLPGAVDGWTWATDDVRRFALGERDLVEALAPAEALGALTARLHRALASSGRSSATAD